MWPRPRRLTNFQSKNGRVYWRLGGELAWFHVVLGRLDIAWWKKEK